MPYLEAEIGTGLAHIRRICEVGPREVGLEVGFQGSALLIFFGIRRQEDCVRKQPLAAQNAHSLKIRFKDDTVLDGVLASASRCYVAVYTIYGPIVDVGRTGRPIRNVEHAADNLSRRCGNGIKMEEINRNRRKKCSVDFVDLLNSLAKPFDRRSSHPMDERRWFDFIIAVHRSGKRVGTDHLARWLEDVEGWDERSANKLASEFERGMALLEREAETR